MAIQHPTGPRREQPADPQLPPPICDHEVVWMVDLATRRAFRQPCPSCTTGDRDLRSRPG